MRSTDRCPRILIVAYHFPPEGSIGTHRTLRLVRELSEQGWDITVLTGTETTYTAGCTIDRDLLARVPEGVKVVRAPAWRPVDRVTNVINGQTKSKQPAAISGGVQATSRDSTKPSFLRRGKNFVDAVLGIPDQHAGWVVPAINAGIAAGRRHKPDVLYSTAPPWSGQLVARALAAGLRCPWVADFRDPWARAPWREGRLAIARRAADVMERSIVRRADAVVFTTRTNLDEFGAFYGAANKFHLVRNGCDREEFENVRPVIRDNRFTLLHAGSLYGGRKPTALFGALAALKARGVISAQSFCFRQIGRVGLSGFDMAAERTRLGLDGIVELVESRPRREILGEMAGASCLLLLQPGTTVSIPGKLFEYMAAGRPILAIAEDGETSALVRATGSGTAVRPDDQAGIERALEHIITNTSAPAPIPLDLFDGALRTRELVAIVDATARRDVLSAAAAQPGRESLRRGAGV